MATDLNRVILIGRLTRDPELRQTNTGTAYCRFSIANNKNYTVNGEKKEEVSFFNCVAWSGLADVIGKYFQKGKQIAIEGRLRQHTWEDQEGKKQSAVEVVVENFNFIGGNSGNQSGDFNESDAGTPSPSTPPIMDDDDTPF